MATAVKGLSDLFANLGDHMMDDIRKFDPSLISRSKMCLKEDI